MTQPPEDPTDAAEPSPAPPREELPPSPLLQPALQQKAPPTTYGEHTGLFKRNVRWVNIAALLALLYAMFRLYSPQGPAKAEHLPNFPAAPTAQKLQARHYDEVLRQVEAASEIASFIPSFQPSVAVQTLREGGGEPAVCGATVSYQLLKKDGSPLSPPRSLRLGDESQPRGLSLGLVGMRAGEVRALTIPPVLWSGNQATQSTALPFGGTDKDNTLLLVLLQDAGKPAPVAELPSRRFVTSAGQGVALRCGDAALLDISVTTAAGEVLFDSAKDGRPVYAELGRGQLPYGIELALENAAPGADFSLLVPPAWMQPYIPPFARP